jgi:2-polyprenyl-3-methyl-5-hydroxy-6-metoxy-1,4-benzoquinol methylase
MICGDLMRKKWPSNGLYYFTCPRCQLDRVAPLPTREVLKDYYDKAYEVDREGYRRNLRRYSPRDLKLLERLNGKGRMLEVGCSWGYFLVAARSCGWHVQGLELSDSASQWAKDKLGLDVTCGTIEDTPLAESTGFDVVVAWHVIEHVQDPVCFLKIVRERLRPGGLLALRTPNIRSLPARLNGWAWHWVGAPAHLSLFSPKSLRLAVERAGFSVRHIATRRGDAYNPVFEVLRASALRTGIHHNVKKLFKLSGKNGSHVPPREDSLANRRSHMLGQLSTFFDIAFFALFPIEKLFEFAGWGPELFLVAERKD